MTFHNPTERLYYHTEKIISVTIPPHFSCHSLSLCDNTVIGLRSFLSNLVIFINKSLYKIVGISLQGDVLPVKYIPAKRLHTLHTKMYLANPDASVEVFLRKIM